MNVSYDPKPGTSERSQELLMNATIIPSKREFSGETSTEEFELPLFDFSTLATATENFSDATKLGQGGFGCVYKVKSQLYVNHSGIIKKKK